MTAQGRYAARIVVRPFGRKRSRPGGALVAVAVVIGFCCCGRAGSAARPMRDRCGQQRCDDTIGGDTADEDTTGDAAAATDDSAGEDAAAPDDTVDTPEETIRPPVTRPPGDVKVAVANGVGEAGLAGSSVGAVDHRLCHGRRKRRSETAQSQVYTWRATAKTPRPSPSSLGDAAVLRPAPSDLVALVTDATAVDGFHVFVILGTDRGSADPTDRSAESMSTHPPPFFDSPWPRRFFLDFDGTLSDIAPTPEGAVPRPACPTCCANPRASAALRSCPVARSPICAAHPRVGRHRGALRPRWRSEGRYHTLREAEEWRPLIQELTDEAVAASVRQSSNPRACRSRSTTAPIPNCGHRCRPGHDVAERTVPRGARPSTPSRCTADSSGQGHGRRGMGGGP